MYEKAEIMDYLLNNADTESYPAEKNEIELYFIQELTPYGLKTLTN